VLPDLEGTRLAARRRTLAAQQAQDRSTEWVLDLPSALFYSCDPVLRKHVEEAEADACYEEFAVLYVAMTRAKRAMYVITEPVGTSKSHNFPRLLQETLGEEWERGDPAWFEKIPPATEKAGRSLALRHLAPGPAHGTPSIRAALVTSAGRDCVQAGRACGPGSWIERA
jgi:ATP-dependent helicase/nuclease subunit A